MNAVEIEAAVSALAQAPFDSAEFPFAFLRAFGNKDTTIKRLQSGQSNSSDVAGGVLQRSNIHLAVCDEGRVSDTLKVLRASPGTASAKVKFILATDGHTLEAEDLNSGETIASTYPDFATHFGFFLPLAGITTTREIKDNPIDIRATGRLNKLYVELLKENPEWATEERQPDMNHFMARLIFCFFAEDTEILVERGLFSKTVDLMTAREAINTHDVIGEIFRAMNTAVPDRPTAALPNWVSQFPYVNGGLFSGSADVPRFSRVAHSYLLRAGELDWKKINPDIFGSMIQAVADDEERGALGMHYTSVPNILKVLNPLFLDDLREQLNTAGDSTRTLLNLRKRMSRIRVFDPACGSGNFLVIAYKEMRAIEAEINRRRGESQRKSEIPLTNFRGIELRDFPAEVARLSLIIAEYQCDVQYRGQHEALKDFLPLDAMNWITCGNALRLDWFSLCPPTGSGVRLASEDLFHLPPDQAQVDFENEGGETYICGNPPYVGFTWQSPDQKADLQSVFASRSRTWKSLDYVSGWFMKAADYGTTEASATAFVSTNSICQGEQVSILWPLIFATGHEIQFAHASFRWQNLASHNAGVTVSIVGISRSPSGPRRLFSTSADGQVFEREADYINAYLVPGRPIVVAPVRKPLDERAVMEWGNKPTDGGNFFLTASERAQLLAANPSAVSFVRRFVGALEFVRGQERYCLWIDDEHRAEAERIPAIRSRIEGVAAFRTASKAAETRRASVFPHRFRQIQSVAGHYSVVVARVSSELREFLPVGVESAATIVGDRNFALYDAPLWNMALIASRLHWVWIGTVCVRLEMRFSYSNTLGWNTFPVPILTEANKADLTRCAEDILLAREVHFPATIADLYDSDNMPDNLRHAHERNDEVLERIYIGRRFRNDTERLEKLFDMYSKMIATPPKAKTHRKKAP